jgi:urease accessory protein UreH
MSGARTGSLHLAASRAGTRTVLERVRYDGISRCSRAFRDGDAMRVVCSQLGPGVVRGDRVTTEGRLHAGAHLIVTQQTATRLLGGGAASEAQATWRLDDGAFLELLGEPLVGNPGARYEATTNVELATGARVLSCEYACVPADSRVRLRTSVRRGGREILYDAYDAESAAPFVTGTLAYAGIDASRAAEAVARLDAASDACAGVRVGVGALPEGVLARVLGTEVWQVRAALLALRASLATR